VYTSNLYKILLAHYLQWLLGPQMVALQNVMFF